MPRARTAPFRTGAQRARTAQFADIDALLVDLAAYVEDLKEQAAGIDPTSWAMTGRGGDLEQLQIDLRNAMGLERGSLPGCEL